MHRHIKHSYWIQCLPSVFVSQNENWSLWIIFIHPSCKLMYSVIRPTWNLQVKPTLKHFYEWTFYFPIPVHNMMSKCGVSQQLSSTERLKHPYFPALLNIPYDIFSCAATLSSSVIHFWGGTPGMMQFLRIICHPVFIAVWTLLKLQWLAQRDAIISGQNKVTCFSKTFCFAQKGESVLHYLAVSSTLYLFRLLF